MTFRKVVKNVKNLKKATKAEIRVAAVQLGSTTVLSTFAANLLSGFQQGSDNGNRQGSKVLMKHLALNYVCYAGDTAGNTIRVTVLFDTQPNGAAFAEADVWQQTGQPISQRFWMSKQRYKFVYDRVHQLDIDHPTVVRVKIPLNKYIHFGNATTGVISNIVKNALWIGYVSDSPLAPSPSLEYSIQMLYTP